MDLKCEKEATPNLADAGLWREFDRDSSALRPRDVAKHCPKENGVHAEANQRLPHHTDEAPLAPAMTTHQVRKQCESSCNFSPSSAFSVWE